MPKETYAHEDVTLICSSGMMPSKLAVAERRVSIAKGKKIATELDKPFNFMCKWMGILAALLAGIICAAMAVPFLAALVIGLIAGAVGAGLGGTAFCMFMLLYSPWNNPHSKVKIGNIKALTEGATLNCAIGGGSIQMFFSPEMAAEQAKINFTKNTIEIAGAALMGRGIPAVFSAIAGSSGFVGVSLAVSKQVGLFIAWSGIGYAMGEGANVLANMWANYNIENEDGINNAISLTHESGSSLPFASFIFGDTTDENGNTVGYGYLENEQSDKEKSVGEKTYEFVQTDYQKPFTEPLSVGDEANLETNRKLYQGKDANGNPILKEEYRKKYLNHKIAEEQNYKNQNPVDKFRRQPNLEQEIKQNAERGKNLKSKDFNQFERQQKQEYLEKHKDKLHEYGNKKNKKMQARQKRNEQKLRHRANQHAKAQQQNQLERRLAIDKKHAGIAQSKAANSHAEQSKNKMFKKDQNTLKAKYTKKNSRIKKGAFAFFFISDIIVKKEQKMLNYELSKDNNPESKAKAGVRVVAIDR